MIKLPITVLSLGLACAVGNSQAASKSAEMVSLVGLQAPLPSSWIATQPSSSMRLAQFTAPSAQGHENAEVIVFYFGSNQGGSAAANIARWQSQFTSADGSPVQAAVSTYQVNGMAVTEAELHGHYARGVGMGPIGPAKPNRTLRAAIIEGPHGKLFVQLHGPTTTVNEQRASFEEFVHGLHPQ